MGLNIACFPVRRSACQLCSGRRPAWYVFSAPALRFWSAPAERSGDGALDCRRARVLTQGSGLARAPNPKRRGASLPAALQKWARPASRDGTIPQLVGSALNTYWGFAPGWFEYAP